MIPGDLSSYAYSAFDLACVDMKQGDMATQWLRRNPCRPSSSRACFCSLRCLYIQLIPYLEVSLTGGTLKVQWQPKRGLADKRHFATIVNGMAVSLQTDGAYLLKLGATCLVLTADERSMKEIPPRLLSECVQ
jgi:hypothetical protein